MLIMKRHWIAAALAICMTAALGAADERPLPGTVAVRGRVLQRSARPMFHPLYPAVSSADHDRKRVTALAKGGAILVVDRSFGSSIDLFQVSDAATLGHLRLIPPTTCRECYRYIPVMDLTGDLLDDLLEIDRAEKLTAIISMGSMFRNESEPIRLPLRNPIALNTSYVHVLHRLAVGNRVERYLLVHSAGDRSLTLVKISVLPDGAIDATAMGGPHPIEEGGTVETFPWRKAVPVGIAVRRKNRETAAVLGIGPSGLVDVPGLASTGKTVLIERIDDDELVDTVGVTESGAAEVHLTSLGRAVPVPCSPDAPLRALDFDRDTQGDLLCWSTTRRTWTVLFGHKARGLHERYESIGAPHDPHRVLVPHVGRFRGFDHDSIVFTASPRGPWFVSDYQDDLGVFGAEVKLDLSQTVLTDINGRFTLDVPREDLTKSDKPLLVRAFAPGLTITTGPLSARSALDGASELLFRAEDLDIPPSDGAPWPCTSFDPIVRTFGTGRRAKPVICPVNHIVLALDDRPSAEGPASWTTCCRLPRDDILTAEEVIVPAHEMRCPPGTLYTGGWLKTWKSCPGCLRCTKVNTDRYELGAELSGEYFGRGMSRPFLTSDRSRHSLPLEVRYGVGRILSDDWDADGCISPDLDSALVSTSSEQCGETRFRALLERTGGSLKRVQILPRCRRLDNPLAPGSARCAESPTQP